MEINISKHNEVLNNKDEILNCKFDELLLCGTNKIKNIVSGLSWFLRKKIKDTNSKRQYKIFRKNKNGVVKYFLYGRCFRHTHNVLESHNFFNEDVFIKKSSLDMVNENNYQYLLKLQNILENTDGYNIYGCPIMPDALCYRFYKALDFLDFPMEIKKELTGFFSCLMKNVVTGIWQDSIAIIGCEKSVAKFMDKGDESIKNSSDNSGNDDELNSNVNTDEMVSEISLANSETNDLIPKCNTEPYDSIENNKLKKETENDNSDSVDEIFIVEDNGLDKELIKKGSEEYQEFVKEFSEDDVDIVKPNDENGNPEWVIKKNERDDIKKDIKEEEKNINYDMEGYEEEEIIINDKEENNIIEEMKQENQESDFFCEWVPDDLEEEITICTLEEGEAILKKCRIGQEIEVIGKGGGKNLLWVSNINVLDEEYVLSNIKGNVIKILTYDEFVNMICTGRINFLYKNNKFLYFCNFVKHKFL